MLDEPARGLHEQDVNRLSMALDKLKGRHTLIINEHRMALAKVADQLLEMGPGPGERGGQIIYQGPPARLAQITQSVSHTTSNAPTPCCRK